MTDVPPDRWAQWLLNRRDAGDERQRAVTLSYLAGVRDRVLAGAEPLDGATVLDVGAGEGLIGLEALERAGGVVFSDISPALLERCREAVGARGLLERARFVHAHAEDLDGVADASVDVVTTRAVLIYVADKTRAFAAFRRVLRPGGRLSLCEPVNRLTYPEPEDRLWGIDVSAVLELAARVRRTYEELSGDEVEAMFDFDDADLVPLAEAAGFERVHVERHLDVEPGSLLRTADVETLLGASPNPLAPTLGECIERALTGEEATRFTAALADALERGAATRRVAVAYLTAK